MRTISRDTKAASRFRGLLRRSGAAPTCTAACRRRDGRATGGPDRTCRGGAQARCTLAAKLTELVEPVPPADRPGLRTAVLLAGSPILRRCCAALSRAGRTRRRRPVSGRPDAAAAMAGDERSHARVITRMRKTDDPSGIRRVERWHRGNRSGALRRGVRRQRRPGVQYLAGDGFRRFRDGQHRHRLRRARGLAHRAIPSTNCTKKSRNQEISRHTNGIPLHHTAGCGCASRGSHRHRARCDGGRYGRTVLQCRAGCHRQSLRDTGNAQINDSAPVQLGPQYPYWAGWGGYGPQRRPWVTIAA